MKRHAYTIIETILYLGLLVVVLTVLVTFMINILRRESKVMTMLEVDQNSHFALDRITNTIRNAKDATVPVDEASGSILTLTMTDASLSPTIFAVTNGVLTMKQGTASAVPLTSSSVKIASINFINLISPTTHQRTEPVAVACQGNQNKRLICHGGNTQCVNKNSKLADGDTLGPCFMVTSAKSTIGIQMTVSAPPAVGPGNEFQSTLTLYDSATVPRQN